MSRRRGARDSPSNIKEHQLPDSLPAGVERVVLEPDECARIEPALASSTNPAVRVYRYTDRANGWVLSIATHGEPGSSQLSLGGFRIAPEHRTSVPGYDNDREAIELAMGMEEKIEWSRLIGVAGPLLRGHPTALVGGKCVLKPTADARVGSPRDTELLNFAVACFLDFERTSGVHLTTGQDLGHGTMSDGVTPSLAYMHRRFKGSVLADTSKPTAEGNYRVLRGMLTALGAPLAEARVGLVGCGNIGEHVLGRVREEGATPFVLEATPAKREKLAAAGVPTFAPERKAEFLRLPLDAVVVNASGGSLDDASVAAIAANPAVRVICGSENLVMPDPRGAEVLRAAGKVYCPTELGGMMGYLTAVEEYLAERDGVPFEVKTLFAAAEKLEEAGLRATAAVRESDFALSFEDAVRRVYGLA
jgi:hypothetical protein